MPQHSVAVFLGETMKVYTEQVKRSPWASHVRVSRTREGRWVLDRVQHLTECPANTFSCWEHAEWTANAWANEELKKRLAEEAITY
jgi:hypothetical protein